MSVPSASVLPQILIVALATVPALGAASLRPEAIAGWKAYVAATEQRIGRELAAPAAGRFLAQDFLPASAQLRREVLSGSVVMDEMQTTGDAGVGLDVPAAMVHHWRGAVFIPGVTLEAVLARLQTTVPPQEDVLRSAILERSPNRMRVYLRLQRTKIVTVVYNSEHVVTFTRLDQARAASVSTSTRIAEVDNPGTAEERELVPGEDHGYLWRLNSYWRYQETAGGVIAECESVSLSRDIPAVFRFLAGPLIGNVARESMERTLTSLRDYLTITASPRGLSPVR